ncbi:MAG: DUF2812 domain-containing protein [Halanaerobiaceae bacterium]|jgi:hypothetical protein|nr:DUF2812 domain-containing protein [Halanaerobiaceae bacterium]
MSSKIKRVLKPTPAWEEEKEEKWLREMSKEGWHLKKCTLGLYTFERAEPADYIYKYDYTGCMNIDKEEYLSIFRDAGWEHVTENAGWHCFRAKADNCRYPDLYTICAYVFYLCYIQDKKDYRETGRTIEAVF